jgi:hypothetical protein
MNENTISPLNTKCELENLGGFGSLRLAYSRDIVQQSSQLSAEIKKIVFVGPTAWVAQFTIDDKLTAELKIDDTIGDSGNTESYSLKATLLIDTERYDFLDWYNKYIRGRRFAVELTNHNNHKICLNPFLITYTYTGRTNFDEPNKYELNFVRAKLISITTATIKVIQRLIIRTVRYPEGTANEVIITLYSNITLENYKFGYSTLQNPETIVFQNDPYSNIIHNLPDGIYYFFAVHRFADKSDYLRAEVKAGVVIIISDSSTPQIITENETTLDEGTFVVPE